MKRLIILLAVAVATLPLMSAGWRTDFDKVRSDARQEHKLILLKFSGSDWCLPCIRMEKQVFSDKEFSAFAASHLEMMNADFPRLNKNRLDHSVSTQNDKLAEQYNKEGRFPYTLLLNADGKVLKSWDGYSGQKPADMIRDITAFTGG